MNFLLTNSFTTFFNNLFLNWKLVLFVVFTILLVLAIFFKRFKTVFFILLVSALAAGGIWLGFFIMTAVTTDKYGLIEMAVAWGPTILFSLTVVLSTLINAKRGRRKSLVLWAQSASAALLWLLLYYFGVKSTKIDASLVNFVNLFMGKSGVQNALGVSENATTFRNILTLYFESLGGSGVIGALLSDTSAYVYTFADMAYHIAFACICYFFYLLTVFILYIIYLCCYSERKYKKKKMKAFGENRATPYKKHRIGGGFVGLARGILTGILSISFIGACLFMVAGRGEGKLKDYEVSGKYETHLKIYRALESYGTQGIFMILNAMSDPADMPYYLLAADLVFSGELDDEINDVSGNFHLRAEFGEFTGLARDTALLLVKYGEGQIGSAVNGTSETGLMQTVLGVMRKKEFQTEFDTLIAEYDSPTFIHNFCMSLVGSLLGNLDKTSIGGSLSPMNKELIKLMFKNGYLSYSIPEDRALINYNVSMKPEEAGEDWDPQIATGRNVRPYIGLQQLVGKEDLRRFIKIFFTILTDKSEGVGTFDMIRSIVPDIKELTLFDNGKHQSVDSVLTRLYCYLQNTYLKGDGAESYSYNALVKENVSWTDEIDDLLDVAEDFFTVYDDVKDAESAVFNRILFVFDRENDNRLRDIELYDKIVKKISSSRLLGKTLGSNFFRKTLTDGLSALFENFYVPEDIVYENTFNTAGKVDTYGELNYFLKGLKSLGNSNSGGDSSLFELLFSGEEQEIGTIISTIADVMSEVDEDGCNFAYYASRSALFRSVISCFLMEGGEGVIYVPNSACKVYEVPVKSESGKPNEEEIKLIKVIESDELEAVLNGMGVLSEFVDACVNGDYYENIDSFLEMDSPFMTLIENSRIAEGSLALLVKDQLCNGGDSGESGNKQEVVVPKYLVNDVESWCSSNGGDGQLKKFIASYLTVRSQSQKDHESDHDGDNENDGGVLGLEEMLSNPDGLLNTIANLGAGEDIKPIKTFLASDIIHYTVSDYLKSSMINDLTVVVPLSAQNMLYDDVIKSVIKRDELYLLFSRVNMLNISDSDPAEENSDDTAAKLLKQILLNRSLIEGDLLSASVVANLVNNNTIVAALHLNDERVTVKEGSDDTFYKVGTVKYLESGYYSTNPWYEELPKLLNAMAALFDSELNGEEAFTFNSAIMLNAILAAKDDVAIMDACYESRILSLLCLSYGIEKPDPSAPVEPNPKPTEPDPEPEPDPELKPEPDPDPDPESPTEGSEEEEEENEEV